MTALNLVGITYLVVAGNENQRDFLLTEFTNELKGFTAVQISVKTRTYGRVSKIATRAAFSVGRGPDSLCPTPLAAALCRSRD